MITVVITVAILFNLDLILHACKIFLRCDRFGILNFTTKPDLTFGCTRDPNSSVGYV